MLKRDAFESRGVVSGTWWRGVGLHRRAEVREKAILAFRESE